MLRGFAFLQEFAAFACRVNAEDYNHGQDKKGWEDGFHNYSICML